VGGVLKTTQKADEAAMDVEDRVIEFIGEQLSEGVSPRELTEALAFHTASLSVQAIEDHFNGMHLVFAMIVRAMNHHADAFSEANHGENEDSEGAGDSDTLNEVQLAAIEKLNKTIH
jgi:hypothetical protein